LLVWGAALPLPQDASHTLRHEAARRAAHDLGDGGRAATLYREILAEAPRDAEALAALGALYEAGDDKAALLGLRQHALGLADDPDARLALRLDIAALHAALGDAEAQFETLAANLDERAGHGPTLDALTQCLDAAGRHDALHGVLVGQAEALEREGHDDDAAALWTRAADLAEARLQSPSLALAAWRRVDALQGTVEALRALSRLLADTGAPGEAVAYLRRLLDRSVGADRRAVVADLARALRASGEEAAAIETLAAHRADDPGAAEVVTLLAELYRATGAWEPLATLLTDEADGATPSLAARREAAEIYQKRLGDAARAVPVLEGALAMAPDDRAVRAALADALRAAGRLDEARSMLDALVESYGRQRPVERAVVHLHLAQIARDLGDLPGALRQLELASAIDLTHTGIFRMLGDVARDLGQLDRAERAYRALLMIVRRHSHSAAQDPDALGPSEVLFALYGLAALDTREGAAERAAEILESAFEAAARSPEEARRFEQCLAAAQRHDLRLRALELRLAGESTPRGQAEVLGLLAEVLQGALARPEEALARRLEMVALVPDDEIAHAAARALARTLGRPEAYAAVLQTAIEGARAAGDNARAVSGRLRLGAVLGEDLGDASAARDTLLAAESEATGEARAAALQQLAQAFAALGDRAGQRRALEAQLHEGLGDPAELSWTLAALELSGESDTVDAGVERLGQALDRAPDSARALTLLVEAAEAHPGHAGVLDLYERVARDAGDAGGAPGRARSPERRRRRELRRAPGGRRAGDAGGRRAGRGPLAPGRRARSGAGGVGGGGVGPGGPRRAAPRRGRLAWRHGLPARGRRGGRAGRGHHAPAGGGGAGCRSAGQPRARRRDVRAAAGP
jgi:thioredoxin-like negative regulator of GroEL